MSFDLLEGAITTQPCEEYVCLPPFFGKDKWTVDPTKIVIRPPKNGIQTMPREADEGINKLIENIPKIPAKRVQFASYVNVHMRCPIGDDLVHYPSKMIEELKRENVLLKDDLLIAEKRVERLESKLKRTQQALARASTINDTMAIWMVVLLLVGLVIMYKNVAMNL